MDATCSCYEDADSKVNYNEDQLFNENEINKNQNKINKNIFYNKIGSGNNSGSSRKINENKRYNNIPETNILINNSTNNDDPENNSKYSSPRQIETKFETEKSISYCSTCTCIIF